MNWKKCIGDSVENHWSAHGDVSVRKFQKIFRRLPYGTKNEDYEWDECGINMQGVFIPWRRLL